MHNSNALPIQTCETGFPSGQERAEKRTMPRNRPPTSSHTIPLHIHSSSSRRLLMPPETYVVHAKSVSLPRHNVYGMQKRRVQSLPTEIMHITDQSVHDFQIVCFWQLIERDTLSKRRGSLRAVLRQVCRRIILPLLALLVTAAAPQPKHPTIHPPRAENRLKS